MRLERVERRGAVPANDAWSEAAAWPGLAGLGADLGVPGWSVDVVLVDDGVMADLNRRWREGEGVTDVLSFTYLEKTGTGEPDLAAGADGAARDLWLPTDARDGDAPTVGEVVVAPAFVADRCAERGWNPDLERALLVVHGLLHLLGWEHGTSAAAEAMRNEEATVLGRHGLAHPLRGRS